MKTDDKTHPKLTFLPIDQIDASAPNHRGKPDAAADAELLASVKESGILTPLLVRVMPDGARRLVAGFRRLKAARAAGLESLPVYGGEMTDKQEAEHRATENIQRQNLNPMEEAEAMARILTAWSGEVEAPPAIARRIGKTEGYVRIRLKLLELPELAKKAVRENRLGIQGALAIARIPDRKVREQAAKHLLRDDEDPVSDAWVAERIGEEYMRELSGAPFDTKDTGLVEKAGSCLNCPKRTGNQALLFPDIARADICTDGACYTEKTDAAWKRIEAEAKVKGTKIVGKADRYGQVPHNEWVKLTDTCYQDTKHRKYAAILGDAVQPAYARGPDGEIITLASRKEAEAILREKGIISGNQGSGRSAADLARERREREKTEIKNRARDIAIQNVAKRMAQGKMPPRVRFLIGLAGALHDDVKLVAKRILPGTKPGHATDGLRKWSLTAVENDLEFLAAELFIRRGTAYTYRADDVFDQACKAAGIDLKKLEAEIAAQMKKPEKPAPAKAKKTKAAGKASR